MGKNVLSKLNRNVDTFEIDLKGNDISLYRAYHDSVSRETTHLYEEVAAFLAGKIDNVGIISGT